MLLNLSFADSSTIELGNLLPSSSAAEPPKIELGEGAEPSTEYTLVYVDPDAPHRCDPQVGLLNHWTITGLSTSPAPMTKTLMPYAPPSARKSGHRSVYLLYKHLEGPLLEVQSQGFKGAGVEDRFFFDLKDFVERNKLELVGINFFISANPGIEPK
ncbi:hypothetical protein MNV49_005928 [Pseudohyphozyma bogoriensis]|nr:hypothetical protein MNV49_005928 [Pseudohyphozyma bogoriensis]